MFRECEICGGKFKTNKYINNQLKKGNPNLKIYCPYCSIPDCNHTIFKIKNRKNRIHSSRGCI